MAVDPGLLERLVCPRHAARLSEVGSTLSCEMGHRYPIVEDVPILLEDGPQTLKVADTSLRQALHRDFGHDPYYVDTIGISEDEKTQLREQLGKTGGGIDPVVCSLVSATNGIAYRHLRGKLPEYPIPELRLPPGNGRVLLDVGCN